MVKHQALFCFNNLSFYRKPELIHCAYWELPVMYDFHSTLLFSVCF